MHSDLSFLSPNLKKLQIMITLQAYRAVIGLFTQKLRCLRSAKMTKMCRQDTNSCFSLASNILHIQTVLCVVIILNMSFLKLSLLMNDGDIESNPGPPSYTILKSVTGTINQANVIFGETAGT